MSEEAEAEAGETISAPKRSKLPLIIMLVAGLLLGGGGAGAYFMFFAPKPEAAKPDQTEEQIAQEKLLARKPIFVEIDRLSAPLVTDTQIVVGHVSLYVKLQVKNDYDQDWIRDRIPMIRHAINKKLTQTGVAAPGQPNKVDFERTGKNIAAAISEDLQTDKVLAALVVDAVRL